MVFSSKVLLIVMIVGVVYGLGSFCYEIFQKNEQKDKLQISLSLVIALICSVSIYQFA